MILITRLLVVLGNKTEQATKKGQPREVRNTGHKTQKEGGNISLKTVMVSNTDPTKTGWLNSSCFYT